jgi:DNA-directed RNA polymerase subunit RPC12/RpoP
VELKKISSTKKCPKCGGSTEILGESTVVHPPETGPQGIKLGLYKCKKCGKLFSDEKVIGGNRFTIRITEHIHE